MKKNLLNHCFQWVFKSCGALFSIWGISILIEGCTAGVQEVKLDAFIGMVDPAAQLGELGEIQESQLLVFQSRSGTRAIRLGDEDLVTLCEFSTASLSLDSDRMICIPEAEGSPVTFVDRLSQSTIFTLPDWTVSNFATPMIANEGSVFAAPVAVPDQLDHIAVYDDFGIELGRVKVLQLHGFVGPDHLVINEPPEIWNFRPIEAGVTSLEELEEEASRFPIGTRDFIRHDYPPYGVIYEGRGLIYFLGVEQQAAIKVGDGDLIGTGERRVISVEREGTFSSRLNVYELGNEIGGSALYSMVLEEVRKGQSLTASMVSHDSVLLQTTQSNTCGDERREYALKSYFIDLKAERVVELSVESEPHTIAMSGFGKYAVINHTDNCGRSMGNADLFRLSDGELVEMPDAVRGQVRDVAVSARGGHIAVMGDEKVWLINASNLSVNLAHSGEQMVGALRFAQ